MMEGGKVFFCKKEKKTKFKQKEVWWGLRLKRTLLSIYSSAFFSSAAAAAAAAAAPAPAPAAALAAALASLAG